MIHSTVKSFGVWLHWEGNINDCIDHKGIGTYLFVICVRTILPRNLHSTVPCATYVGINQL